MYSVGFIPFSNPAVPRERQVAGRSAGGRPVGGFQRPDAGTGGGGARGGGLT